MWPVASLAVFRLTATESTTVFTLNVETPTRFEALELTPHGRQSTPVHTHNHKAIQLLAVYLEAKQWTSAETLGLFSQAVSFAAPPRRPIWRRSSRLRLYSAANSQHPRGFGHRAAQKIPQLHQLRLSRRLGGEPVQHLVDRQELERISVVERRHFVDNDARARQLAAVLAARFRRARSTRIRRMASAAAAKKWPKFSQCCSGAFPTKRR